MILPPTNVVFVGWRRIIYEPLYKNTVQTNVGHKKCFPGRQAPIISVRPAITGQRCTNWSILRNIGRFYPLGLALDLKSINQCHPSHNNWASLEQHEWFSQQLQLYRDWLISTWLRVGLMNVTMSHYGTFTVRIVSSGSTVNGKYSWRYQTVGEVKRDKRPWLPGIGLTQRSHQARGVC